MYSSLDDVARAAGVSSATVSRALRDLPSVKPETKRRIQKLAHEMGYVISPSASNLATGKTRTIGLLTPWVNRWFFANIIEGAEKGLRQHNYDALLYTFHETPFEPRQRLDPQVLRRRVDGVLVLGLQLDDEEVASLANLDVPIIFLGPGHSKYTTVGIDDFGAATLIMNHLVELGHTKIGHIAGPDMEQFTNSPSAGRYRGWRSAVQSLDLPVDDAWRRDQSFDQASGMRATHGLLDAHPDLTAIFAATDTLAIGVMRALSQRGLKVGTDIAVAGIDDEETAKYVGLTTVRQDPRAQGVRSAQLLLSAMAGEETPLTDLGEIELIERASSGRISVRFMD